MICVALDIFDGHKKEALGTIAVNRLERLYKLHDLLRHARHPIAMRRLENELGVQRNTIGKDIQYFRTFLGAPIVYDTERNGYHYDAAADVFELPGLWLNASELHALLVCEQLLESVQPGLMEDRLKPLRQRIRGLLKEAGHSAEEVSERVSVQAINYRSVDADTFRPVADALLSRRQLLFQYQSRGSQQLSHRQVSPQRLLHYRDNWYLLAQCHSAEDLRLFSLDRISKPQPQKQVAHSVSTDQLDVFSNQGFGIFSGTANHSAHLRFSPHAARWVAEEHWHAAQRGEWQQDGYHLHVPYSDPTELVMEILRHGAEVEVLGPETLREAVANRVRDMAERYWPKG